jgi:plasmid stabilization system protein ParE
MAGRTGAAVWSPEALVDLEETWNYYERVVGTNTAEKIAREIIPRLKLLGAEGIIEYPLNKVVY